MQQKSFVLKPTFTFILLKNIKHIFFFVAILVAAQFIPFPFVSLLAIIPIMLAGYNIIYWRLVRYEITQAQVKYSRGVFNYKADYLEIYRIKDYEVNQPFFMRIFQIMNVTISTSDNSHPVFTFEGLPKSNFPEALRDLVEIARKDKRVYEID